MRRGKPGGRDRRITLALALLTTGSVLACTDLESPVNVEPDSLWEANIAPAAVPDPEAPIITGQAAAVVQNGRTEVGIQVNGLQTSVRWGLFEGTCRQPGSLIGSAGTYPALSPDTTSAEAQLGTELSPTESYNIRVGSDPDGGATIACGELEPREEV